MDEDERLLIVNELKLVDNVFLSIDKNQSVELSIKELFNTYNKNYDFFFVNHGDQNNDSIPEVKICKKLGIKLIDGLGIKFSPLHGFKKIIEKRNLLYWSGICRGSNHECNSLKMS